MPEAALAQLLLVTGLAVILAIVIRGLFARWKISLTDANGNANG